MAENKHPIINAVLDGMTDGIENAANAVLVRLKAQQEAAGDETPEEAKKRADQIAQLEKVIAEIGADREKRTRAKEEEAIRDAETAEKQANPAEELKPWWKDMLSKPENK